MCKMQQPGGAAGVRSGLAKSLRALAWPKAHGHHMLVLSKLCNVFVGPWRVAIVSISCSCAPHLVRLAKRTASAEAEKKQASIRASPPGFKQAMVPKRLPGLRTSPFRPASPAAMQRALCPHQAQLLQRRCGVDAPRASAKRWLAGQLLPL